MLIAVSDKSLTFTAEVMLFPQVGGWRYVQVPDRLRDQLTVRAQRGLIPVTVTVGASSWPTSLLPKGDGTHFIALNAKVREAENIELGDRVRVSFVPRSY